MKGMSKPLLLLSLFSIFWLQPARANIVGTDLQNFNPTSSGLDFITVHSTDTLDPGIFNLGTFFSYATNSLPYFTLTGAPSGQKFLEPNDSVIANDLHIGYGIMKSWDIGVSMASILSQSVDNSNFLGTFSETGMTDLRINTKFRLFRDKVKDLDMGLGILLSADFDRIVNNPFSGDNAGPTFNIEGLWDMTFTRGIRWGINFGYRMRNAGTEIPNTGVTPIEDQLTYSSALALEYDPLAVMFEVFGSTPLGSVNTPTDRKMSNLQALSGVRWHFRENLDFHGGAGIELYHGLGSSDLLVYLGVNWRLGGGKDEEPPPIGDEDGDGVLDDRDQCPGTAPGTPVNNLGCDIKRMEDIVLKDINFFVNSAKLTAASRRRMRSLVAQLQMRGKIDKIVVEGHTDSTGRSSYNLNLSQRRAQTIADVFVADVPLKRSQVVTQGYGEERPIASNETATGRAKNRRVELHVIHHK